MALAVALPIIISGASMALQYFLAPKAGKQQPIDKGKLDDIRITSSDYGTTIPRLWGKGRISGNLIWSSGITHTIIDTPTGGGKGSPQAPAERTHVYTTSVCVLICRGQVQEFLRVWADADLIINNAGDSIGRFEAENASLTGGATTETDETASNGEYAGNLGNGGQALFDLTSIPNPPFPRTGDPEDLVTAYTRISFFYKSESDLNAVISITNANGSTTATETIGCLNSNNQWTPQTVEFTGFAYTLTYGNASADAPDLDYILIEKFWVITPFDAIAYKYQPYYQITGAVNQNTAYPTDIDNPSEFYNAPLIADGTGKVAISTTVPTESTRFYQGTETQEQDSAIVAYLEGRYGTGEGVLRTSAHRGLANVVFENRQLKNGRVENYTFEVDCGDSDVNDVLQDLFADVGLVSGDYDLTATAGLTQVGFIEHTKSSRRSLIESLERYHFFRLAEIDGKLKTVLDTTTPSGSIANDLLKAHSYGEEMPKFDAEILIKEENLLPREVRVSILNPDLEYHNESVSASLFSSISSTESKEYTFPIVDNASNARTKAELLLLKEHSEDKTFEFYAMPETAKFAIGDVITVTIGDVDFSMRIEKKQMTLPIGRVRFQCVSVSPFAASYIQDDFTALANKALNQFVSYQFPRNSIVIPIISEPLNESDKGKLGLYLAVGFRGRGSGQNIAVMREFDDENFILQYIADAPAQIGLCAGTLAETETGEFDTSGTLDIWFFDEVELETVLSGDLVRYPTLNLLRVGNEWIQFRVAEVQTLETNSPYRSKWRVSDFVRGRFGTISETASHVANEYAVRYTQSVKFFGLNKDDIGETVTFKAVTNGQAEENGQTASIEFNPLSAYSVTNANTLRSFDANATTINELADVLATVIEDNNL